MYFVNITRQIESEIKPQIYKYPVFLAWKHFKKNIKKMERNEKIKKIWKIEKNEKIFCAFANMILFHLINFWTGTKTLFLFKTF